ncbi:hypothetical protein PG997_012768 [Apiospora hydei]|uniref:Major facilitator superfamily (MFS) profile domain-containing protein n=1 Tax=Apiospora hydei TaxID=1337664 RepID=A0ABR1V6R7_9PEZI
MTYTAYVCGDLNTRRGLSREEWLSSRRGHFGRANTGLWQEAASAILSDHIICASSREVYSKINAATTCWTTRSSLLWSPWVLLDLRKLHLHISPLYIETFVRKSFSKDSSRTIHGWRWAAAAASLYVGALIYGLDGTIAADIQTAIIEQFNDIDWAAFVGGTGAMVSLTMVLTFAGGAWTWNDGRTIAIFLVCGALFVLTFLQPC